MRIGQMIVGYTDWFHQQIDIEDQNVDNTYIISVPFLDKHNDYMEIIVTQDNDRMIHLSDGGYMRFEELGHSKFMDTEIINSICRGLGVTNSECLRKHCTVKGFPVAFNMFITCMIKVSAVLEYMDKQGASE
jgi:hypothetical protein